MILDEIKKNVFSKTIFEFAGNCSFLVNLEGCSLEDSYPKEKIIRSKIRYSRISLHKQGCRVFITNGLIYLEHQICEF